MMPEQVSGLYQWFDRHTGTVSREELRLDVDGPYPQFVASGTLFIGSEIRVHWIAKPLATTTVDGTTCWSGPIVYKNQPVDMFPYTQVIVVIGEKSLKNGEIEHYALATFTGNGLPARSKEFSFILPAFHKVEFEFDQVEGVSPVLSINLQDHLDHAPSVPSNLDIETVFENAGIKVTRSPGVSRISPTIAKPGVNSGWSNAELNDAMEKFWSRFADQPQWMIWVLFADKHEEGGNGIMFDDIGPYQRQGTAIFLNSFDEGSRQGDSQAQAWVDRLKFFTTIHEIGHAFNLVHSHDKLEARPWMPSTWGYNQLSFMNYPHDFRDAAGRVLGDVEFFKQFEFRFTDEELLFLRHAPEHFVQMGNAPYQKTHIFCQASVSSSPKLKLTLSVDRKPDDKFPPLFDYDFLEPVVAELKLTRLHETDSVQVAGDILTATERMTIGIKRQGRPIKFLKPRAHVCRRSKIIDVKDLNPESLFLSVGKDGWMIAEPGIYEIRVCIHLDGENIVSNSLSIRVKPPSEWTEEILAQDYFTDDVARVLDFDGTQFLERAETTLREIANRLSKSRAAVHALVALGMPKRKPYKTFEFKENRRTFQERPTDVNGAMEILGPMKTYNDNQARCAVETLGHIDAKYYVGQFHAMLEQHGKTEDAKELKQRFNQAIGNTT